MKQLILIIFAAFFLSSCNQTVKPVDITNLNNNPMNQDQKQNINTTPAAPTSPLSDTEKILNLSEAQTLQAVIKTNMGDITVSLFDKDAPKAVANFVGLSEGQIAWTHPQTGNKQYEPLYNGTIFHRVIADFMIQGGDPIGMGTGGPGYKFEDEPNNYKFDSSGILAMANSGPNTNGSQFFITLAPTPWLNGKHTIFGKVVEGMDVVEKIGTTQTGVNDRPVKDIKIENIEIVRK